MELKTTSPFLQHENSLKTHEKLSILPDDVKETRDVLSELSIIGNGHDGRKKYLRQKQQEDRVLIRHVPKKVLDVFVGEAVYNQSSLDRILCVRLPSKADGRSALILDLESPASQISSLSECSPFASEISGGDRPSLLGEAEEKGDLSPDSGCNIIVESSLTSTPETLPNCPEQSSERATAQLDSKRPDTGEEKEKKEEKEGERKAEEKTPRSHTGSSCVEDTGFGFLESTDVRRCSSSFKTSSSAGVDPPSTKKEVRFADALVGLDHPESVEHNARGTTDPPAVPPEDLRDLSASDEPQDLHGNNVVTTADPIPQLRTCFAPPGSSGPFPEERIYDQKVVLESLSLNDLELSVSGSVYVANISYVKRVCVRFTTNDWQDFVDLDATYSRPANEEGGSDEFLFKINLPKSFGFGGRLEFAVCYEAAGRVFWDNNFGANYRVEYR